MDNIALRRSRIISCPTATGAPCALLDAHSAARDRSAPAAGYGGGIGPPLRGATQLVCRLGHLFDGSVKSELVRLGGSSGVPLAGAR